MGFLHLSYFFGHCGLVKLVEGYNKLLEVVFLSFVLSQKPTK
jgi:hypothetical protein